MDLCEKSACHNHFQIIHQPNVCESPNPMHHLGPRGRYKVAIFGRMIGWDHPLKGF